MKYLWSDRKRHMGMPISFTKYSFNEDRVFKQSGFLNLKEEEILLYRIRDLQLDRSLWQRMFGVGTVHVHSSDKTSPHLDLLNVKDAREVKEQLFKAIEAAKIKRRMRSTEILEDSGDIEDLGDFDNCPEQ